ncbi:MAG: hypothetical protein IKC12_04460 [Alistipes sp.]|nr:hypothetical protein [Alistipes sp.]
MKKFVQYFVLSMAMVAGIVSCNKEEPVEGNITDYYIECSVKGGGLNSQELYEIQTDLNYIIQDVILEGYNRDEAIYIFDGLVTELKGEFGYGMDGITEPLKITLTLKTINGKKIKASTLTVTKDSCKLS